MVYSNDSQYASPGGTGPNDRSRTDIFAKRVTPAPVQVATVWSEGAGGGGLCGIFGKIDPAAPAATVNFRSSDSSAATTGSSANPVQDTLSYAGKTLGATSTGRWLLAITYTSRRLRNISRITVDGAVATRLLHDTVYSDTGFPVTANSSAVQFELWEVFAPTANVTGTVALIMKQPATNIEWALYSIYGTSYIPKYALGAGGYNAASPVTFTLPANSIGLAFSVAVAANICALTSAPAQDFAIQLGTTKSVALSGKASDTDGANTITFTPGATCIYTYSMAIMFDDAMVDPILIAGSGGGVGGGARYLGDRGGGGANLGGISGALGTCAPAGGPGTASNSGAGGGPNGNAVSPGNAAANLGDTGSLFEGGKGADAVNYDKTVVAIINSGNSNYGLGGYYFGATGGTTFEDESGGGGGGGAGLFGGGGGASGRRA